MQSRSSLMGDSEVEIVELEHCAGSMVLGCDEVIGPFPSSYLIVLLTSLSDPSSLELKS
jgi:hypothetical protein